MHENHAVESNHGTKSSMCIVGYAIVFLSCVCIYAWDDIIRGQPIRQNIRDPKQHQSKETQQKKMPHAARKKYKYNLKDEEAEKTNRWTPMIALLLFFFSCTAAIVYILAAVCTMAWPFFPSYILCLDFWLGEVDLFRVSNYKKSSYVSEYP